MNQIKNRVAYLLMTAFLFCFTANVEAQVFKKRVVKEKTIKPAPVCPKEDSPKYISVKGQRVLKKQNVHVKKEKRIICATSCVKNKKMRNAVQKRKLKQAKLQPEKKYIRQKRKVQSSALIK